jgi:hypothetical protein
MSQFELLREPVLDHAECAGIVEELLVLRSHWVQRTSRLPFFTFGAAGYADGARDPSRYLEQAAIYNPLLRERFGWLLDRTRETISRRLGLEADWFPRGALPGFHIYLAHNIFALPVGSIHYDLQHEALDLSDVAGVDLDESLSFTLPISLPSAGGGLNTWERKYDPAANNSSHAMLDAVAGIAPTRHPYQLGEIVMHSGYMLHQPAPAPFASPNERRITLQGHGIRAGERLYLYW